MHLICHSKSHCNENERFCVHEFPNIELLSQRAGLCFYLCCYILAKCFLEGQYLPQWKSVSAVARIRDTLLSAQHRSSMWWAQWVTAIMSKQVLFDPLARWAPVDPFSSRLHNGVCSCPSSDGHLANPGEDGRGSTINVRCLVWIIPTHGLLPPNTLPCLLSTYFTITCLCTELLTRVAYHFLWRVTFTFDFMHHQEGKNY